VRNAPWKSEITLRKELDSIGVVSSTNSDDDIPGKP